MWYYNHCNLVTAPSGIAKGFMIKSGCRNRIEVVSNGVDTKKYNPKNRDDGIRSRYCPNKEFLVLHVGRITTEKNVSVLIEAGKILNKRGFNFKLVIIGDGPARSELQTLVRKLGLGNRVVFTGRVPEKDLPKYYASADLFITASTVETQGIVLLEAMASGCPVIGANAGAIPELIVEGHNGSLFDPGNSEMLANLTEDLLEEDDAEKTRHDCLKTIKEHSIESVTKRFEGFYKELVG